MLVFGRKRCISKQGGDMNFFADAKHYEKDMIADIRSLMAIESVRDDRHAGNGQPFGPNIRKALETMLKIGIRDGFQVKNVDGYAGLIQYGDLEESVGVLGHLDVVPVGDLQDWHFDPLKGEIKDGFIMGRGSGDDKGPAITAYYAMRILKDHGFKLKYNIQCIFGTDEETTSAGILYYKKHVKNPIMGIVPDAQFPCIHAEKGILDFRAFGKINSCIVEMQAGNAYNVVIGKAKAIVNKPLEKKNFANFLLAQNLSGSCYADDKGSHYHIDGKPFHASKPYHGVNAAIKLLQFIAGYYHDAFALAAIKVLSDPYGSGLEVAYDGAYMGALTFNLGKFNIADGKVEMALDYRYPNECTGEDLLQKSKEVLKSKLGLEVALFDDSKWLLVDPNSELVNTVMKHYRKISGDYYTPPLKIGGGTYARTFANFVACGPVFPDRKYPDWVAGEHEANEGYEIETMLKACAIYANILYDLACEK